MISDALDDAIRCWMDGYDLDAVLRLKNMLNCELIQPKGTSLHGLIGIVQAALGLEDSEKARQIAQTLVYHASNLANKRAWQQSDVVKTFKWRTAEDTNVCEFCTMLDGKGIALRDNFLLMNEYLKGKKGGVMFASRNIETPPLHEGCRCYCRPDSVGL